MNQEMKRRVTACAAGFSLPRYRELPSVGLYLDQTVQLVNSCFRGFPGVELTPSMVSNYVKKGVISHPVKKKYSREQLASLIYIVLSKNVLSLENIDTLFQMQRAHCTAAEAYDYFCDEVENCLPYFPLMMLAVVFSILCEGTVYGNTIARKPFQDTIGTAVGVAANIAVCAVLVPRFGVMGAAVGLVAANATMFLYRTVTGQYYYRTIPSFSRTICGFLLAVGVAVIGVVFAHNFIIKFVLTAAILFIYCNIYRAQLYKLWQIFMGFVRRYLLHSQA